jgi:hypothetical protein
MQIARFIILQPAYVPFSCLRQLQGEQTPPVEFDQLMTVQSKFEEVLEESAGGVSLPLDMKEGRHQSETYAK